MATTQTDITEENWLDLGPAQGLLQTIPSPALPVAADVLFVLSDAEPGLDAPAHQLRGASGPLPLNYPSLTLFVRAPNKAGARVAFTALA
ncbi:hypothetical protein [Methylobacterium sp. AMS5]|uniref:hypothetical protein n=1 Tax=Methylobacterium sp. AMS5 TaxID=925818 RepID=UPI00074F9B74|nr:hypothetical protein [Methylobacterium sp. AMS5]AMB48273.1 hypothetical protein Y590_25230 [Methylobacterium sp. AMS5]